MTLRELIQSVNGLEKRSELELQVAFDKAHEKVFSDTIVSDVEEYIPYKTGVLNSSRTVDYGTYTIDYSSCSYAKYAFNPTYIDRDGYEQYKDYTRTEHPLACGNPIDTAYDNHVQEWVEEIANLTMDILLYEVEV